MTGTVFAAAQCSVVAGAIAANVRRHLDFMDAAHGQGVDVLVFPELSLTGYEPTLAAGLAQAADTDCVAPLRARARETGMTAIVGLPLRSSVADKAFIAAFILHPDGSLAVQTKQHLHAGEERYFSAGTGGSLLDAGGMPLALAICADFGQPAHAAAAASAGARLYAASALVGESGYPADSALLQGHAQRHGMAVLLANHGGPTGGWTSAGRSAFWDEQGRLVAALPGPGDGLLVVRAGADGWTA
ncbi:Predicted amidohydrolase [Massilia sp. PDC64]|nr:carbon-nitrogen hydrolase family protein [Massilia sp. PDC64]SDD75347.1 Predicted amidohydrolase [Massilia sp. PDC64]